MTGTQVRQLGNLAVCVVIPVYNDWDVVRILLQGIDAVAEQHGFSCKVVLLDDGSTAPAPSDLVGPGLRVISRVDVLELRKNMGHQRALCVGLVHLQASADTGPFVIMDADGEDAPSDIPELLERFVQHEGRAIVFAARAKRAEGAVFKIFYRLFQSIHWLLVGSGTRIGNFSVVPRKLLDRMVVIPELWNHYAAAVVKSRLPFDTVPLARGKRLGGRSRMSFVGLIIHGLSAIAVYGDTVGVRLLIASAILSVLAMAGALLIFAIRVGTTWAVPGWATYTTGFMLIVLLQSLAMALVFTFIVLYSRSSPGFIPVRDCRFFIGDIRTLFSRND